MVNVMMILLKGKIHSKLYAISLKIPHREFKKICVITEREKTTVQFAKQASNMFTSTMILP